MGGGAARFRPIQTCSGRGEGIATPTVITFPEDVTAGNMIAVGVATYIDDTRTVTVSDSILNPYPQVQTYSSVGLLRASLWFSKNISGGPCSIAIQPNGATYLRVAAREYAGADTVNPLDGISVNSGTSTIMNTGIIPVSAPNEMVVGVFVTTGNIEFAPNKAGLLAIYNTNGVVFTMGEFLADSDEDLKITIPPSQFCTIGASFKGA